MFICVSFGLKRMLVLEMSVGLKYVLLIKPNYMTELYIKVIFGVILYVAFTRQKKVRFINEFNQEKCLGALSCIHLCATQHVAQLTLIMHQDECSQTYTQIVH